MSKSRPSTATDIKVLKVRDGEGQELKDARFVEVMREAGAARKLATEAKSEAAKAGVKRKKADD